MFLNTFVEKNTQWTGLWFILDQYSSVPQFCFPSTKTNMTVTSSSVAAKTSAEICF